MLIVSKLTNIKVWSLNIFSLCIMFKIRTFEVKDMSGLRWLIVLFVFTYAGNKITGVNTISKKTVEIRASMKHKHAVKSIQVFCFSCLFQSTAKYLFLFLTQQ